MDVSLRQAVALLKEGKVVAIPTETVYGLAANAYNPVAVANIFRIKRRPLSSPLIVHVGDYSQVKSLVASIPTNAEKLAHHFWAGPLTLLLPKKATIPDIVTAKSPCVGIRIPAHPLAQRLLAALPFPLAAPSANPFRAISPTTPTHVTSLLGHQVAVLHGGAATRGLESTIIGFADNQPLLYRLGSLTQEQIEAVVGPLIPYQHLPQDGKVAEPTPGRLPTHYAPRTRLVVGIPKPLTYDPKRPIGILAFDQYVLPVPTQQQFLLSSRADFDEAASRLFAGLHYLDGLGLSQIFAHQLPNYGLGATINDRLRRAAHD